VSRRFAEDQLADKATFEFSFWQECFYLPFRYVPKSSYLGTFCSAEKLRPCYYVHDKILGDTIKS
jgi:hypothetical protein